MFSVEGNSSLFHLFTDYLYTLSFIMVFYANIHQYCTFFFFTQVYMHATLLALKLSLFVCDAVVQLIPVALADPECSLHTALFNMFIINYLFSTFKRI